MPCPPFSVQPPEVHVLFGDWCKIELLDTQDVLTREPQFRAKGVSQMLEQVYWLTVI